jgi:hypothetical protein
LLFLGIVALFVGAIGLTMLVIDRTPDRTPADQPPTVLDQRTVAAYITESSEMLGGMQVGDPCPDQWPSVSSPLPMEPVSVSPENPNCKILAWIPGTATDLPADAHYLQDGSLLAETTPVTTAAAS